jgi:hypothetical protein
VKVSGQLLELIIAIYQYVDASIKFEDFEQDSRLRPVEAGNSHEDRMRALRFMLDEGLVASVDGVLCAVKGMLPPWLVEAAANGDTNAFRIADRAQPNTEVGSKFDHELLREIGSRGEAALMKILQGHWGEIATVTQVSLFDDSLGFDLLAVFESGYELKIEVKTTSRPKGKSFPIFISRNEYEVAEKSNDWRLALMRIVDSNVEFEGVVDWEQLKGIFPADRGELISWASAKVEVPPQMVCSDLPAQPALK